MMSMIVLLSSLELMHKTQGFTLKNEEFIRSSLRNIAKLEQKVSDKDLRWMLYEVGVYAYREFHKAGLAADIKQPALSAPKKVYDKESGKYVNEQELMVAWVMTRWVVWCYPQSSVREACQLTSEGLASRRRRCWCLEEVSITSYRNWREVNV